MYDFVLWYIVYMQRIPVLAVLRMWHSGKTASTCSILVKYQITVLKHRVVSELANTETFSDPYLIGIGDLWRLTKCVSTLFIRCC
jgi:hypothetical protein